MKASTEVATRSRCHLPRVSPNGIVAALIAATAQVLEYPDRRQPFAAGLRLVRRQQLIKIVLPRANPRQRLLLALVAELGRLRPQNLPHHLPRDVQLAADRLGRLALNNQNLPRIPARPSARLSMECNARSLMDTRLCGSAPTPTRICITTMV